MSWMFVIHHLLFFENVIEVPTDRHLRVDVGSRGVLGALAQVW